MIRQGKVCRGCSDRKCVDKGTETQPIQIECPSCNGGGCDGCDDGYVSIIGCPNEFCRDIVPAVNLADLFDKGLPPVAGGALDQAAWFINATRILNNDEATIKAASYV